MPAEVRLVIGAKEARLTLTSGGKTVEEEVWKFSGPIGATEATDLVTAVFQDAYDIVQFVSNGD